MGSTRTTCRKTSWPLSGGLQAGFDIYAIEGATEIGGAYLGYIRT